MKKAKEWLPCHIRHRLYPTPINSFYMHGICGPIASGSRLQAALPSGVVTTHPIR